MKIVKNKYQPKYEILVSTNIDCDGFNTVQLIKRITYVECENLFFDICSNEELPILIKDCSDIIYKEIENELQNVGKN